MAVSPFPFWKTRDGLLILVTLTRRCRANSAHLRQSRPDYGLGLLPHTHRRKTLPRHSSARIPRPLLQHTHGPCTAAPHRAGVTCASYLRLIDSCVTQLKVQGPSRTCNESKEERPAPRSPCARPAPPRRPTTPPQRSPPWMAALPSKELPQVGKGRAGTIPGGSPITEARSISRCGLRPPPGVPRCWVRGALPAPRTARCTTACTCGERDREGE